MEERHVFVLLWKIENFLPFDRDLDQMSIPCPDFNSRAFKGKPFHVQVCIRGESRTDDRLRVVFSWLANPAGYSMDSELAILGANGSPVAGGIVLNRDWQRYEFFELNGSPTLQQMFVTHKSEFLPKDTLTVRCRIWARGLAMSELVSCRTVIDAAEHGFLWPVFGFSDLDLKQEVISPVTLDSPSGQDTTCYDNFHMKFQLKGESIEGSHSDLSLHGATVPKDIKVHVDVSLLDDGLKVAKSVRNKHMVFRTNTKDVLLFPELFSRKEIMAEPTVYLRGDVLTLHCQITAYMFTCYVDKQQSGLFTNDEAPADAATFRDVTTQTCGPSIASDTSFHMKESLDSLVRDFRRLYYEGNLYDFQLRLERVSYPVHRAMLCARSPVFRETLSERTGPEYILIQNTKPRTLNRLLVYLYTGTLEPYLGWENAADLYRAAEEYRVQPLKDACSSILRSLVAVPNVGRALKFAESNRDEELGSFVCDFFVDRFDYIVGSVEWRDFMDSDSEFAGKMMLEMYKRKFQVGAGLPDSEPPRPTTYFLL